MSGDVMIAEVRRAFTFDSAALGGDGFFLAVLNELEQDLETRTTKGHGPITVEITLRTFVPVGEVG